MVNPHQPGNRPTSVGPDTGRGWSPHSDSPAGRPVPDEPQPRRHPFADLLAAVMLLLATLTYLGRLVWGLSQPGYAIAPRDFGSLLAAIIAIVAGVLLVMGVKPGVARITGALGAGALFLFNAVNLTGGSVDDVIGKYGTWAAIPIVATTFIAIVALYRASWSGTEHAPTAASQPRSHGPQDEPASWRSTPAAEQAPAVIAAHEPEDEQDDEVEPIPSPFTVPPPPEPYAPEPQAPEQHESEPRSPIPAVSRQSAPFGAAESSAPDPYSSDPYSSERAVPQSPEYPAAPTTPRQPAPFDAVQSSGSEPYPFERPVPQSPGPAITRQPGPFGAAQSSPPDAYPFERAVPQSPELPAAPAAPRQPAPFGTLQSSGSEPYSPERPVPPPAATGPVTSWQPAPFGAAQSSAPDPYPSGRVAPQSSEPAAPGPALVPRQPEPFAVAQPTTSEQFAPYPPASQHAETDGLPAVHVVDPPTTVLPRPGGASDLAQPGAPAAAPQQPGRVSTPPSFRAPDPEPAQTDGLIVPRTVRSPMPEPERFGDLSAAQRFESSETAPMQSARPLALQPLTPPPFRAPESAPARPDDSAARTAGFGAATPVRPVDPPVWQPFGPPDTTRHAADGGRPSPRADPQESSPQSPGTVPIPAQSHTRQPVLRQPGGFLAPPPIDSRSIPAPPPQRYDASVPERRTAGQPPPEETIPSAQPDHVQSPPKRLAPLPRGQEQ